MSCLTRLLRIFRRPASLEAQIDQEIDSCLEMLIDDEVQAGLTPKEAEQAARQKIGNIHRIRDRARHGRSEYMFDIIAQDVRYGIQSLKKNRAFAGTAIAAVGIGIASVTCVFGFVNSMLWQPPGGVKDPATLIALYLDERVTPEVDYRGLSYPQYDALLRRQDVFSDLIFYMGATTHNLVIHIVARAVVISVIGAGVGLVLSSVLGRFTKNQFYNLSAQDPLSMAVAGFAALWIAALASYLPAREAARIDPSGPLKGL